MPSFPSQSNEMRVTLEGHVERITYSDPASHFTIAKLKVKGQREPDHYCREFYFHRPRRSVADPGSLRTASQIWTPGAGGAL